MTQCVHELDEGTCSLCLGLEIRQKKVPTAEKRASELFDFAANKPAWTLQDVAAVLGWSEQIVTLTIRELRAILADDDINLVVDREEDGIYRYKLVGGLDQTLPWANNRLKSVESQLHTIAWVTASICKATRANSRDGRRARLIAAQMNILQLQLDNLKE